LPGLLERAATQHEPITQSMHKRVGEKRYRAG
jgi:hypothetical protein